jgi:hypothetical protein
MSAKTRWWYCGECGFKNHPRPPAARAGDPDPNDKCEQCGNARDRDDALDYSPAGA